jgi:hypothetical protein
VDTEPKIHNRYYLGTIMYCDNIDRPVLQYSITLPYFFSRKVKKNQSYDLLQLCIEKDVYYVIIKTYWLRIVQKKWKERMNERKKKIHLLHDINVHFFFSLRGRYIRKFSDINTSY